MHSCTERRLFILYRSVHTARLAQLYFWGGVRVNRDSSFGSVFVVEEICYEL